MKAIVCSACGEHVFDTNAKPGDAIEASALIPAHLGVARPNFGDEVRCPLCESRSFINDLRRAVLGDAS